VGVAKIGEVYRPAERLMDDCANEYDPSYPCQRLRATVGSIYLVEAWFISHLWQWNAATAGMSMLQSRGFQVGSFDGKVRAKDLRFWVACTAVDSPP